MTIGLALSGLALFAVACGPKPNNPFRPPSELTAADDTSIEHARQMDAIEAALDQGDLQLAQRLLDEAFAGGLSHPRAYYQQARLYARFERDRRQIAKAVPWLIKTCEASPHWHEPRLLLADCYMRLDRLASAEDVFVELDNLFPRSAAGPYGQSRIARLQDRDADAQRHLDEALDRQPNYPAALYSKASMAKKSGDSEAHYRYLQRYLTVAPLDAAAFLELGNLQEQGGRLEDARRSFERSYELQPDTAVARRLGDLARRQGDQRAAAKWDAAMGLPADPETDGEAVVGP